MVIICVLIPVGMVIYHLGSIKRKIESNHGAVHMTETLPTREHPRHLRLTTTPSEPVMNIRGHRLVAQICTPNLWWATQVNSNNVYELTPVNYPESKEFQIREVVFYQQWYIQPISKAPGNQGKQLEGELLVYYEPVR